MVPKMFEQLNFYCIYIAPGPVHFLSNAFILNEQADVQIYLEESLTIDHKFLTLLPNSYDAIKMYRDFGSKLTLTTQGTKMRFVSVF